MAKLQLLHPVGGQIEVDLGLKPILLGRRGGKADVELNWDSKVSRHHARVWVDNGAVWLKDLESTNGCWLGTQRLASDQPLRLEGGVGVLVGETTVTLLPEAEPSIDSTGLSPGVTLQMQADARSSGIDDLMSTVTTQTYVSALYEVARQLIQSSRGEFLVEALRRIFKVVPAAQRIALVAWPSDDEGNFQHLVSADVLVEEGMEAGPISRSLAALAVENRQALFFSQDDAADLGPMQSVIVNAIRSAVYVPLLDDSGEVAAILCVDTPMPTVPFGPEDFQFIRAVGALVTAALDAERLRDEARLKELEAHRHEARREAMTSFLKIASHDLKNPIAVIQMGAHALRRYAHDEEVRNMLADEILDAGRRARALIDTYLEVTAVESGRPLLVQHEEVDPHALVDEEILFFQKALPDGSDELYTFRNDTLEDPLQADRSKLRQIFANLISNACKYSPKGGEIAVASRMDGAEIVFSIRDQGVGISAQDQQRLFSQFQRVGDTHMATGTGLGLWLTQALIQAHGGRIWLESAPGEGTTFFFSLPTGEVG